MTTVTVIQHRIIVDNYCYNILLLILIVIHQPLAQQLFISATRGWLFQTQFVILDTPSSLTFAMTMMCCLRPVIWSRRQIIFLSLFLVLDQVSSLAYSTPSVYLFMVQLCGPSAVPQFELLRFLLISYCVESGGYLLAVTLQLCIILLGFPAFLM